MMNVLLVLLASMALAQQADPVIDWLTSLQSMQARLQDSTSGGDRDSTQVVAELRSLRMEINSWSASQADGGVSPSPLPDDSARERLLAYVTELRQALEQYARKKPGSPFWASPKPDGADASPMRPEPLKAPFPRSQLTGGILTRGAATSPLTIAPAPTALNPLLVLNRSARQSHPRCGG